MYLKIGLGPNLVRLHLSMRKGKYFTFLFDYAENANINLHSALRIQLEEGLSYNLGIHLLRPFVTSTTFAKTTTLPMFRLQGSKFRVDKYII